jgi:hypothetical protein
MAHLSPRVLAGRRQSITTSLDPWALATDAHGSPLYAELEDKTLAAMPAHCRKAVLSHDEDTRLREAVDAALGTDEARKQLGQLEASDEMKQNARADAAFLLGFELGRRLTAAGGAR